MTQPFLPEPGCRSPPLHNGKKKESEFRKFGLKWGYVTLRNGPILLMLTLLIYKRKITALLYRLLIVVVNIAARDVYTNIDLYN